VRLDRPARGVIVAAGVGCVMCPNYAREPRTGRVSHTERSWGPIARRQYARGMPLVPMVVLRFSFAGLRTMAESCALVWPSDVRVAAAARQPIRLASEA
jgi:hypothetical protein